MRVAWILLGVAACTSVRSTARIDPGWSAEVSAAAVHPLPGEYLANGVRRNTQYPNAGVALSRSWVAEDGHGMAVGVRAYGFVPTALELRLADRRRSVFQLGGGLELGVGSGAYLVGEVRLGPWQAALAARSLLVLIGGEQDTVRFDTLQISAAYRVFDRVDLFLLAAYWRSSTWVESDVFWPDIEFEGCGESSSPCEPHRREFLVLGGGARF